MELKYFDKEENHYQIWKKIDKNFKSCIRQYNINAQNIKDFLRGNPCYQINDACLLVIHTGDIKKEENNIFTILSENDNDYWITNKIFPIFVSGGGLSGWTTYKKKIDELSSEKKKCIYIHENGIHNNDERFINNFKKLIEKWKNELKKQENNESTTLNYPTPDWSILEDKKGNVPDFLLAFNILIQGYLAIHKPEIVLGDKVNEFIIKDKKGAEEKTKFNGINDQCLIGKSDNNVEYWFGNCYEEINKYKWDDLPKEKELPDEYNSFREIWNLLHDIIKNVRENNLNQECITDIISNAYNKYNECIKKKELEEKRDYLNHTLIQNEFYYSIYSPDETNNKIIQIWNGIKAHDSNKRLTSHINSVKSGFDFWKKELYLRIKNYFNKDIEKCNFQLTSKGIELKNAIVDNEFSYINIISSFINDFDNLCENENRKQRLNEFLQAIESLKNSFSDMALRNNENGIFGGYLEYINNKKDK